MSAGHRSFSPCCAATGLRSAGENVGGVMRVELTEEEYCRLYDLWLRCDRHESPPDVKFLAELLLRVISTINGKNDDHTPMED